MTPSDAFLAGMAAEAGVPVVSIARAMGVSQWTIKRLLTAAIKAGVNYPRLHEEIADEKRLRSQLAKLDPVEVHQNALFSSTKRRSDATEFCSAWAAFRGRRGCFATVWLVLNKGGLRCLMERFTALMAW
jgi:hypothetical protein